MKTILTFCLHLVFFSLSAQTYTSWITGDTADVSPAGYQPGLVLAGGGGDNDEAMTWMLERADGGDVVVIRASGSDGYNSYFFSQLGVTVNSVETIRFDDAAAAEEPYVQQRIQEAEVLFIAGGDQYDYYEYWKDNAIEEAIQYLLTDKQITVGGTSAGMAILGNAYYTPSSLGVLSSEALNNPFHSYINELGWNDFLDAPFMDHTITDTHFDQRERAGRTMTFLARLTHDHGFRAKAITANEYTAVCIDENGLARAFGEYPQYEEDLVYFLQVNCQSPIEPEICQAGMPLHWVRDQEAVKACVLTAKTLGSNTFNLMDWTPDTSANWENWWVENGILQKSMEADPADCANWSATGEPMSEENNIWAGPNPFSEHIHIKPGKSAISWTLHTINGVLIKMGSIPQTDNFSISTTEIPAGLYILTVRKNENALWHQRLLKLKTKN